MNGSRTTAGGIRRRMIRGAEATQPMSRARWVAAIALALLVATVCVRLGFWQLSRLETRRAANAEIAAAIALPVLPLDSAAFAQLLERPDTFVHRVVTLSGTFDHDRDLLLRGRAHQGGPGVHLVSLLRPGSGLPPILVNRGWLPAPDAATADPRPYRTDGPVEVRGSLQWIPDLTDPETPLQVEMEGGVVPVYRRLDHATLSETLGSFIPRLYLQALPTDEGSARLPAAVPPPQLDEGPHLGYAIQWFSFAAIAIGGLLIVGLRARRQPAPDRRRTIPQR